MILVLMSIKYCGNIQTCFVVRNIWEAVKIGFPITIVWWALAFQTSLDRVISSSMLGQTQTGYYGLGISVVGTLLLIPQAIAKVLYPKINEGIGKKLDFKGLSILVVVPVRILSIIIPLISGMLVITLPLIYSHIFPKYKPGLLSAQILMVGFFFVALIGNGVNYLVARNRQNILFILVISSIVINATVAIILIKLGLGIEGVAIGTCIAAFALATSIWSMVLSNLGYDNKALLKEIFNLYSPFLLAIGLILIISCFSPSFIKSTSMLSIAYLCLFIICYLAISLFIPPYKRVSRGLFEFVSIRTRRVRL